MGWWKTLTGAEISQKIDQYAETLGAVLLGVHADMQAQQKQMTTLQQQSEEHAQRIEEHCRQLREHDERMHQLQEQLLSAMNRWQQVIQTEISQQLGDAESNLQAFASEHLNKAQEELLRQVLNDVRQYLQQNEVLISRLRRHCLFAYLFAMLVGVVVWMLK